MRGRGVESGLDVLSILSIVLCSNTTLLSFLHILLVRILLLICEVSSPFSFLFLDESRCTESGILELIYLGIKTARIKTRLFGW